MLPAPSLTRSSTGWSRSTWSTGVPTCATAGEVLIYSAARPASASLPAPGPPPRSGRTRAGGHGRQPGRAARAPARILGATWSCPPDLGPARAATDRHACRLGLCFVSAGTSGQPAPGRDRRGHPGPPGRGGGGGDRVGEDDPAAEDLPGAGAGGAGDDRAHPARRLAGQDRGQAGRGRAAHPAGADGRLPGSRFTDRVSGDTQVKLMTDRILLAELERDRSLRRYDDHHRRGPRAQPQRRPARVPGPAAAPAARPQAGHHLGYDRPERFSRHFGGAPVVEVSGRTYPVEVRYRPLGADPDDDRDRPRGSWTRSTSCAGRPRRHPGLPQRRAGDPRRRRRPARPQLPEEPGRGRDPPPVRPAGAVRRTACSRPTGRRVVLATNVAETSLTVPGVKYVVDPGTARISAAATGQGAAPAHRAGVAGLGRSAQGSLRAHHSDGICIRLYAEGDFARPARVHQAGILRTNLASVILQMAARCAWGTWPRSPSSTRPTGAASRPASTSSASWAPSTAGA